MWDPEEISKNAKDNYDAAWSETKDYVAEHGDDFQLKQEYSPHPLVELQHQAREELQKNGFDEIINKDEKDAWIKTIKAFSERRGKTLQLFTVENSNGASYASFVVMDERISLDSGTAITKGIIDRLVTKELQLSPPEKLSQQYAQGVERCFSFSEKELAHFGMLSPILLSEYGVSTPVFYAEIRLDRIGSLIFGVPEKEFMFPQFFSSVNMTDDEISRAITVIEKPNTELGKLISKSIIRTALDHGTAPSPCRYKAFEKEFVDRKLQVWLFESEPGTKLCGPACINEMWVYDGNILAMPPSGMPQDVLEKEAKERGKRLGISMISAFADEVAARVENFNGEYETVQVKNVASGEDINILIPDLVKEFVLSKNKRLSIKGPVFVGAEIKIER